jgi:hypothetical protein
MPFRCFSCALSFDTVGKFVEHKFTEHKPVNQEPPQRDTILRYEETASTSSSKANCGGDILCPNWRATNEGCNTKGRRGTCYQ